MLTDRGREAVMTSDNAPLTAGWLVEVRSRRIKDANMLFAVAIADRHEAREAVINTISTLHCSVHRTCGLTARTLAQLRVRRFAVKQLELPISPCSDRGSSYDHLKSNPRSAIKTFTHLNLIRRDT